MIWRSLLLEAREFLEVLVPGAMDGTRIRADSQRFRAPMAAPGLAGSRRGFWLLGLLACWPVGLLQLL